MRIRFWGGVLLLCLLACGTAGGADPVAQARSELVRGLRMLAAAAQRHYITPASHGGGGGAFDNSAGGVGLTSIDMLTRRPTTLEGTFVLGNATARVVSLYGYATVAGSDGNPVGVVCSVYPDSITWTFMN